jgi:hypothetical protein
MSVTLNTPDYEQIVRNAYGSIGRTGIGSGASNIDQAGLDYWINTLKTGASTPEAFNRNFQTAVADYITTNSNDEYSQYVKNYLGVPDTTATTPTTVATGIPVTTVAASIPTLTNVADTVVVDPTVKLFQDTLGRAPTQGELERFSEDIKAGQLSNVLGYARNEAVNTLPSTGAAANIASQILAQGTTDKWVGEGYGSATKNAYDMGVMLAGQGIKDINDFGQRTTSDGEKEFFNKATGEAIKPFYDRAGGNIWGGTFAGKDSTAYGVEFDASGKPIFYSQSGGDSADVPSWVVPALIIGGAYFGLDASGLLGGAGGAGGAAAAGTAGAGSLTAGITLADIAAAEALLPTIGGATAGLLGGSLTAGITPAQIAAAEAALPAVGSLTSGITVADIAASEAGLPAAGGSLTAGITPSDIAASEAGLGAASLLGGASSVLGGGAGLTASDVVKLISSGTTIAGINAATDGGTSGGPTQYSIVDVPANWATPPKTSVALATVLPPINFGDRNLLRGTQWEELLNPNYGQVPEPIQYSQPSSLSYNDLMSILGSKQGMPLASTLSINDIISGIQNQYGQAPSSAMG